MADEFEKIKTNIREYNESMTVEVHYINYRPILVAYNEAGFNSTLVDLWDVCDWMTDNIEHLIKLRQVGAMIEERNNKENSPN